MGMLVYVYVLKCVVYLWLECCVLLVLLLYEGVFGVLNVLFVFCVVCVCVFVECCGELFF